MDDRINVYLMNRYEETCFLAEDGILSLNAQISQEFFIKTVQLSVPFMSVPNPYLASLPRIRKHPENLLFDNGKKGDLELIKKMLFGAHLLPDCNITFNVPIQGEIKKTFRAGTSLLNTMITVVPETKEISQFLVLKRTDKENTLLLKPNSLPIGIFDLSNSVWTIELLCLPDTLPFTPFTKSLVKTWLTNRSDTQTEAKKNKLLQINRNLESINTQTEFTNFLGKLVFVKCASRRVYRAKDDKFTLKIERQGNVIFEIGPEKQKILEDLNISQLNICAMEHEGYIIHFEKSRVDVTISNDDFLKILEAVNLSLIDYNEKSFENSLTIDFPSEADRQCEIPQIVVQSKLNNLKSELAANIVNNERLEYKKYGTFGWISD